MRAAFDGPAGGSAEDLAGVSLEELCRAARNGTTPEVSGRGREREEDDGEDDDNEDE